jgi:L-lysine 2,3-aminomutase
MTNYLYQEQNWQSQLSDLITDPRELLGILQLAPEQLLSGAILASEQFKLRVPRAFVGKMQAGRLTIISERTKPDGRSLTVCAQAQ